MEDARQNAFQKLRPACVELSSVALKFRGRQTTVKNVSQALDKFHEVLKDQIVAEHLNEKLAEYAFFPLTHIFNESQRLPSRCLELAVLSLQILAAQGWCEKLSPEMGKQLLILLTMIAGGSPGKTQTESPSDGLKISAFNCIGTVVTWLGASSKSKALFDDVGARNTVDQLVFLLLEAISEDASDKVQLAASQALMQVNEQVANRLVLASLLPRTVSTLTKVLRSSTQQRRMFKVLEANLNLLRVTLQRVLNDQVAPEKIATQSAQLVPSKDTDKDHSDGRYVLDQAWLKATSAQVKIALTNVVQLRKHDRSEVKQTLARLCLMVLEECSESLAECTSVMLETLVFLSNEGDMKKIVADVKYLLTSKSLLVDELKASLHKWLLSLPRLMQASDDRPRRVALAQISAAVQLLASMGHTSGILQQSLPTTLIDSVTGAIQPHDQMMITTISDPASSVSRMLNTGEANAQSNFQTIILTQKGQQGSLVEIQSMIASFSALEQAPSITRAIIDTIPVAEGYQQLSTMWLALQLLSNMLSDVIDDFLVDSEGSNELSLSKPFLISDLYSYTLPFLIEEDQDESSPSIGWQNQALALECLVLQAGQLGTSYRSELMDSLYPVLSLLGSRNGPLQQHAMTALNLLANACQYSSVTDMLVDNVDYLVNSIALKLNSSNLAPQAPQVLLMMVRLCGARLIPYIDDLISSIFVALDDFHGYPRLVELLFEVLSAIVDEGAKQPALAITDGKEAPEHQKAVQIASGLDEILGDVTARKSRKRKLADDDDNQNASAPQRPWSDKLDGPAHEKRMSDVTDSMEEGEVNEKMPVANSSDEKEKPLSKPHQLMLHIGQATTPHLSSPSPRVRHTLLNLLDRITPILAKDENSFLPLINTIWPSLTARLFGEVVVDGDGEAAFNVCAAAETISRLCGGAGDFMAGRIEEIFPQLQSLWHGTWKKVETNRTRKSKTTTTQASKSLASVVDLQLVKPTSEIVGTSSASAQPSVLSRTTDAQILDAMIKLLAAILKYVRVTDDNGDAILLMLKPIMDESGRETVLEALEIWNVDAVWVARERRKIEREMREGIRGSNDWVWKSTWTPTSVGSASPSTLPEVVF